MYVPMDVHFYHCIYGTEICKKHMPMPVVPFKGPQACPPTAHPNVEAAEGQKHRQQREPRQQRGQREPWRLHAAGYMGDGRGAGGARLVEGCDGWDWGRAYGCLFFLVRERWCSLFWWGILDLFSFSMIHHGDGLATGKTPSGWFGRKKRPSVVHPV